MINVGTIEIQVKNMTKSDAKIAYVILGEPRLAGIYAYFRMLDEKYGLMFKRAFYDLGTHRTGDNEEKLELVIEREKQELYRFKVTANSRKILSGTITEVTEKKKI